jgi:quinol monooxygenase YgiN
VSAPSPLAQRIRAALGTTDGPFTLIVRFKVKPGADQAFVAAIRKTAGPSRKEPGCVAYDVFRDAEKPSTFVLYERWTSPAALLDEHLPSAHVQELLGKLGDLLVEPLNSDLLIALDASR